MQYKTLSQLAQIGEFATVERVMCSCCDAREPPRDAWRPARRARLVRFVGKDDAALARPQAAKLAQQSLEHYIKNQHTEWFNSIDPSLTRKLEYNLILIEEDKNGELMLNFDRQLLSVFNEVHYWERLHMEIPLVAMEIASQREKYRVMYENVLLVVSARNSLGARTLTRDSSAMRTMSFGY